MKSKLFRTVLSAISLLMLAGCASSATPDVTTTSETTSDSQSSSQEKTEAESEESVSETAEKTGDGKTTLSYIGHACIEIKTAKGTVIYVDPYRAAKCEDEADVILVTHQHDDHNKVDVVPHKDTTQEISNIESLKDDKYNSFEIDDVKITAVPAYNDNHRTDCVGYIIEVDGIKIYHAGDTSKIDEMADLTALNLDYALLPTDGAYNMGIEEAIECADIIGAKHNIPIHTQFPEGSYNQKAYDAFYDKYQDDTIVKSGESMELSAE